MSCIVFIFSSPKTAIIGIFPYDKEERAKRGKSALAEIDIMVFSAFN